MLGDVPLTIKTSPPGAQGTHVQDLSGLDPHIQCLSWAVNLRSWTPKIWIQKAVIKIASGYHSIHFFLNLAMNIMNSFPKKQSWYQENPHQTPMNSPKNTPWTHHQLAMNSPSTPLEFHEVDGPRQHRPARLLVNDSINVPPLSIWWLPEMGLPPVIIHFHGIFHSKLSVFG